MKKALILGIAGQDGSYLSQLLKEKGYEVSGVRRKDGDLLDANFVRMLVEKRFDEIYNFASVSTVQNPWEDPTQTIKSTGLIPLGLLEAIRLYAPQTKFFQASSAEMYGSPSEVPQRETTLFAPRNPYGLGKLLAHTSIKTYREVHAIFAVSGILFNHESPLRSEKFVTGKISKTLSRIQKGTQEILELGNLDAVRDWSYAGDIVEGAWLSLQQKEADDYVFASGQVHSVREFVEKIAAALGMEIVWQGGGTEEKGLVNGKVVIQINPNFFRPAEPIPLQGDILKAKQKLNWQPKVSFDELVRLMATR